MTIDSGHMQEGVPMRELHVGWKECGKILHPLLAMVALVCLLNMVGWTGKVTGWSQTVTIASGLIFSLERGWSVFSAWPKDRERGQLFRRGMFASLVMGVTFILLFHVLAGIDYKSFWIHLFVQSAVLVSGLTRVIYHQKRLTGRAFHPGLVMIGSFMFIVVVGALLLKMPLCTVPGKNCSWLDALFTSTSAVCVTGLSVQNTAHFFTPTGQTVVLLLIQIGGLGIMTLTFFAAVVLFEGLSLHDRLLLGKMIQENRLARVGETLKFIVLMTLVCESVGAVILFFSLEGFQEFTPRLFHAVFHSVSAFCNAGFSTFPDGLAGDELRGGWVWQIVIMCLIVIGGLGALVNEDVSCWAVAKYRNWRDKEFPRRRLRIHTRFVLGVSMILIFGGALLIFFTEFCFWEGPQNGGKVLTSVFHSVTARTAGFNTVPMSQIGILTVQVLMILMVVGGSPGGTAGGLRTTVAAMGIIYLWHQLRGGRRGMVIFNRTVPSETGSQALGLIFLTGIWLMANFIVLQMLEMNTGVTGTRLLFELISAFATVGLSLDLTPVLTPGAKLLMIVNMFVGRIGLLTFMLTLVKPDTRLTSGKPKEDILLT